MIEFELGEHEFIPLNTLLKLLNFVRSGGEANQVIDEGFVKVNDVIEKQKRKKLRAGDKVKFQKNVVLIKV
ncbi:MAG TPA: RNA-binding S4 domain-containing protein [Bacteroidales bacterium]|nr:RNA-binding S4 domain-containing protein [Bacteroidales bacterium]HPS18077.1 RNA-binding S4 domain-containing protein [Bacteroidales bacterium]